MSHANTQKTPTAGEIRAIALLVQSKATERKEVEALRTSAHHFASVRRATTEHLRDLTRVRDIACVTMSTRDDAARTHLRRVVRQRNARLTSGRLAAAAERFAEDAALGKHCVGRLTRLRSLHLGSAVGQRRALLGA